MSLCPPPAHAESLWEEEDEEQRPPQRQQQESSLSLSSAFHSRHAALAAQLSAALPLPPDATVAQRRPRDSDLDGTHTLSTAPPAAALAAVQKRARLRTPGGDAALTLLSLLGLETPEAETALLLYLTSALCRRIPRMTQPQLTALLERSLPFITVPQLAHVPVALLEALAKLAPDAAPPARFLAPFVAAPALLAQPGTLPPVLTGLLIARLPPLALVWASAALDRYRRLLALRHGPLLLPLPASSRAAAWRPPLGAASFPAGLAAEIRDSHVAYERLAGVLLHRLAGGDLAAADLRTQLIMTYQEQGASFLRVRAFAAAVFLSALSSSPLLS